MSKSVLLILLVAAAAFVLSGCSVTRSVRYANSEQYSVGEAKITDSIEVIEIDWPSGDVRLDPHGGNAVLLSENAKRELPEELRVHWWVEGAILRVKFAAPGASLMGIDTGHKELTLSVPEDLALKEVAIRSTSAKIHTAGLTAETLDISTASGSMDIDCAAQKISLNSTSGHIKLTERDKTDEIGASTVSGKIHVELGRADKVDLESTSGKIGVTAASVDSLAARSTSGGVACELAVVPSDCTLHTVSGKVELLLPDGSDFTAKVRTASGDFASDFPLQRDGDLYVCGSGRADMDIETTSGNISVRRK